MLISIASSIMMCHYIILIKNLPFLVTLALIPLLQVVSNPKIRMRMNPVMKKSSLFLYLFHEELKFQFFLFSENMVKNSHYFKEIFKSCHAMFPKECMKQMMNFWTTGYRLVMGLVLNVVSMLLDTKFLQ